MKVSIIDDEYLLRKKMHEKLQKEGYSVSSFSWYHDFMNSWNFNADLYLIDIWLSDGIGFEIIEWIRNVRKEPAHIIIVSGYSESEKVVYGLNIGANDYIVKPFVPDELTARVKAGLRKSAPEKIPEILSYKDILFNISSRIVTFKGMPIHLTRKEALMLELFLKNIWIVIQREEIIRYVWWWYESLDVSDNIINVSISVLRKKFHSELPIIALYSEWYIFEDK
jgi:DNA-binding response OmpR family regulator